MIPIVDVTGTYIFGFGSRSAAIGSLTRGISPLQSLKIGSSFVKFATQLRFEHSFVRTAKLSSSYTIAASDRFTTVKPAKVFANDAVRNVYKYAGLRSPSPITTFIKFLGTLRFEHSFVSSPKVFANDAVRNVYKYAGLRSPKLFTISRVVNLRFEGDIGSITYSPKLISYIVESTLNKPLDQIAFSFCDPGEVLSAKFYLNTELFKTSTIKGLSPFTMERGFIDVFGGTSAITPPVIVSITDSRYTTTFNYGSGMNSSYLANILTTLSTDYTNTPFTGMRIVKIYSALPPGWQQTDQQQPTKILIQFWS